MKPPPDERPRWLDDPAHVTLIYRALIAACLALVGVGYFVLKGGHFWWEESPGFYGLYGFVSCVLLVALARGVRRLLKRPEDYYDR
ncbi:MAG TPA: hypothetical protein VJL31_19130 [Gemmatimonadales bacterium]|jgi:hypothetical protein|nr:hypothetical protein [Gemmatimonadales bacterium]